MLNKIFSWFENRLNPYPDQSPKTPENGLFRFIWSSIEGMKGWILLLAVLTIGNGVMEAMCSNLWACWWIGWGLIHRQPYGRKKAIYSWEWAAC